MRKEIKITKPLYCVSYTKGFEDNKEYIEQFYYGDNALDIYADFFESNFDDDELEIGIIIENYDYEMDVYQIDGQFYDGFMAGMCGDGIYYDLLVKEVPLTDYDGTVKINKAFMDNCTLEGLSQYVKDNIDFPRIETYKSRFSKEDIEIARALQEQD